MEIIVGTAGHIDHGKTALVKALTGIDADRLPEEKRRGITVDLGFAEMSVGDAHFGFVDVPGHERFVKNMLAGASGIDLVLLVIAADEGVMPQTREHFDICRLLNVRSGLVVLTKCDLVDEETLELARHDVAELIEGSFLQDAQVIAVSSKTGEGIDKLQTALLNASQTLVTRSDKHITRLPIDRSFSIKGFGAVVTGTLVSGEIREGGELELLPQGRKVRVRGLQTHGKSVVSVTAGNRTAVNLGGIDHSEVTRGMMLVEPGTIRLTQIIDVEIEVLPGASRALRSRQRVRIHLGTTEELARIQILNENGEIALGENGFAQIRLEKPVVAIPGERFIVRSYSPQATIAGGRVIDAHAEKHRRREFGGVERRLRDLLDAEGDDAVRVGLMLDTKTSAGLSFADLQARTGLRSEILRTAIATGISSRSIVDAGGYYLNRAAFDELLLAAEKAIQDFHKSEPLLKGMSREALRDQVFAFLPEEIFRVVISTLETNGKIMSEREIIRLASYRMEFTAAEMALNEKIRAIYLKAGLEVPKLDDALAEAALATHFTTQQTRKFFQMFLDSGEIVKVSEEFYFELTAIENLVGLMRQFADNTADRLIDVPKFKELAGVSRKYAIPLIEYFDREKITRRVGDKRIVL